MKVGFIGLGIMGFPMASNLLKAGYDLTVYNRTIEKAEKLGKMGAKVAHSPKEVAEVSEIVISMVTDAPDVEEVLFGENGVVKSNKRGLIFVDMSTNSPEFAKKVTKRLSEYGMEFLDAPVTGGDKGAREGTLTIMVGGKEDVFKRVEPIFKAMGKNIIHVGDVGSGQALKLCNQVVVALNMVSVVEGLLLARSLGIDDDKLFSVLSTGAANSFTVQYYLPKIMKGDLNPGFKAAHLKKDLKYAMEIANSKSLPLLGTSLALQLYNAMVSLGIGELGTQGLVKVYEKLVK
ncbi:NAD(P)-dependent oxidoreductase [Saccharolobus solfataricus]|uniref:Oxidoreductase n=3 Tax=Saccharolobus solfataricus TaxID=2287 RepID=Q97XZ7_SACS2|nr:NAD(P)-dependent oxidoreductase [Saccharolobus solfataricus]AAK41774.1 Oxidoreductase [Saccharolobus solfataricus P2]AKA74560.1 NAD(P)-dependent oxidoreductase [Saccharolobus solfataricus]AKA77256.1 NAD(P)-dependent oxidoreductase [Saccharolobus solfataricus]AKA79948.1 NAD(P)-dependent oxidoreductase [Saccharolobus solfataricus]AZF69035.1 NAD(P)-dependent oxidoreductase [Saccharolobus solfataricus]